MNIKNLVLFSLVSATLSLSGCGELSAGGAGSGGTGPISPSDANASTQVLVRVTPNNASPSIGTGGESGQPITYDSPNISHCKAWSRQLFVVGSDGDEVQTLSISADSQLIFKAVIKNISQTEQTEAIPACGSFELKTQDGKIINLGTQSTNADSCDTQPSKALTYQANEQREFILNWTPVSGKYQLSMLHKPSTDSTQSSTQAAECEPVILNFEISQHNS